MEASSQKNKRSTSKFDNRSMFSLKQENRLFRTIPFLVLACSLTKSLQATDPSWWRQDDTIVISNDPADNKSVANVGQAKWMAKCALKALRKIVPQVANAVESDLVGPGKPISSWTVPTPGSDEFELQSSALLVGQLKAIAKPFYDHLHDFAPEWLDLRLQDAHTYSSGSYYPWTLSTSDDNNHGLATLGQLKAAFALDFASDLEGSAYSDGIPDLWEYGVVHADTTSTWTNINQINVINAPNIGAINPAGSPPNTISLQTSAQVDSRLEGKSASLSLALFLNYTDANCAAGIFTRNPNFWAEDLVGNLTCISPWNDYNYKLMAGTAITKRHIIFAHHYLIPDNTILTFITADGETITRKLLKSAVVPNQEYLNGLIEHRTDTDLQIGVLEYDLPSSITPCLVPPANFNSYLPKAVFETDGVYPGPFIPGLALDRNENGGVNEMGHYDIANWGIMYHKAPMAETPKRAEFFRFLDFGDSGDPGFFIINNRLILSTVWTGGNGGSGDATWRNISTINSTINAVDIAAGISPVTGYTLTEMDLSEFVKF